MLAQEVPAAVQVRSAQQVWPAAPQAAHELPLQATLPAVQVLLAQHACDNPPQVPQLPLVQVPVMSGQVLPEATQLPATQQPPLPQTLPAQQAWPGPPQATQLPLPQARPELQVRPVQQAWPAPPHC
jgi:hypothetical protein